jgi:methylenetetrahydrofolate dehydrogenase (NADP+) / methenyltetrahydrofolate cyclohydrolase
MRVIQLTQKSNLSTSLELIMPGIFGDDFLSLLSPLATAQYRPTPTATFPNPAAPAPGPLSIPPAQPPIFLSPPNLAGAPPVQPASPWDSLTNALRFAFPDSVPLDRVIDQIRALNDDPAVHGILVQLPLPPALDLTQVLGTISVDKDVDGFHLYNVGGLVVGNTVFPPCTPYGVVKLLEHKRIALEGKNVVVVGASNNVGKPMALMLMQQDATVCICHAKTRDLAQFTILADILVVAAGHPRLISAPMVRTGAVVIDVGINRLPNGKLVGDVDFEGVREKASYITPVPGGVGPMTVTMLLVNTINSAERVATAGRVLV